MLIIGPVISQQDHFLDMFCTRVLGTQVKCLILYSYSANILIWSDTDSVPNSKCDRATWIISFLLRTCGVCMLVVFALHVFFEVFVLHVHDKHSMCSCVVCPLSTVLTALAVTYEKDECL